MNKEAEMLRDFATRCREMAADSNKPAKRDKLLALAANYDEQAAELDHARQTPRA